MNDWFNNPWTTECHPPYVQYISFTGILCALVGVNVYSIEGAKELFDKGLISIRGKTIKDSSLHLAEGIYAVDIMGETYTLNVAGSALSERQWQEIFDYKYELISGFELTYQIEKHDVRMRLTKPINSKSKLIMCYQYGISHGFGVKYVPNKENYFTGCGVPIT